MAITNRKRRLVLSQRGGGQGDPNRYMVFATRNRSPSGALVVAGASTNHVATRFRFGGPEYASNSIRLHFSGFASTEGGNSPQETMVPGNDTIIDEVWIESNGVFTQALFLGNASVTIASAALGAWTDNIILSTAVPADGAFYVWTFYHTNAAQNQIPMYKVQTHNGERVFGATDLATNKALMSSAPAVSTASLMAGYGGQPQSQYYGPDQMVAKGWDGRPVALCVTDSIGHSRQEFSVSADARGNMGWLSRWLDSNAGGARRIPHFGIGMPGAGSVRELTGAGGTIATRRWDVLDQVRAFNADNKLPFTVILNQMGQNDTDVTYAGWFTRYTGLVTRLRARYPGVKIVACPPLGRTDQMLIAALTSVSTTATAQVSSMAHLATGQVLTISGATPSAYNGTYVITVTGGTTFTYTFAGGTSPATGTIRASDGFHSTENQVFAAYNAYPANAGDNNTGKWRLRDDILAKTSACCDDYIDTFTAWSDPVALGKWKPLTFSATLVNALSGTWGNVVMTAPPAIGDLLSLVESTTPAFAFMVATDVVDNGNGTWTVTDTSAARTGTVAAGAQIKAQATGDGVHPYPSAVARIVAGIPQSEKAKLAA